MHNNCQKPLFFHQLASLVQGKVLQMPKDREILFLSLDSRKLAGGPAHLFFAIRGVNYDSHVYIRELYQKGVRQFVVERSLPGFLLEACPEASFLLVKNSVDCLQRIAQKHREAFDCPVVGITGSNGKTIVKEWLSQLLSRCYSVVKSPKSYNSQVGVPLAVWEMAHYHQAGVFEAGISQTQEMERLEKIIQPTLGVFTNIGPAHEEGFSGRKEKVQEKAKLFVNSDTVVYCKDHREIDEGLSKAQLKGKKVCWSRKSRTKADFHFICEKKEQETQVFLKEKDFHFFLPFSDEASVENALHVAAVLWLFQVPPEQIRQGMRQLAPVHMRLELKRAMHGCYVIDDSYNNDKFGLSLAVDFLQQAEPDRAKTLILTDIDQSGQEPQELYLEVAEMLEGKGIERILTVGSELSRFAHLFPGDALHFQSTEELLKQWKSLSFEHEVILVKGARRFRMERLVKLLEEKAHGTRLEVSLDALAHNLNYYRRQLQSGTRMMVMVKALAYGNGSYEIANLLQYHRVDYLGVAYADEGVELRRKGIRLPIMVMNVSENDFDNLLDYHLEPELFSFRIMERLGRFLQKNGKQMKVHLKINTGMNRLGFEPEQGGEVLERVRKYPCLKVAGIFSHLVGADSEVYNAFSHTQCQRFDVFVSDVVPKLPEKPLLYIANSAAILRFPEYHFDMVRLGIGLYGIETNEMHQSELRSVSTLKTVVSQVRTLKKGETVGYSRSGQLQRESRIATIAIGYADGFSRQFGNGNTSVKINGHLAPTVGNVCMDMTMVDVTGLDVQEGDEVIIFDDEITVSKLAERLGTIPYEILTSIGQRVKRVFVSE
ncbi:MAG: bifunctional UDP-N-acetylmuramoyl-tripeptide:D-alanyl-D-alanine ligase/alanine racemase [Cytophagales bacterium]|nr:bifunctional UDP-N-acetylmuramoyl-tripeptide:D-alanyl-D-alanine ligase/alanine racemase [Cytophagales bacterium]